MDAWQTRLANALTQGDIAALPEIIILLAALVGCSSFGLIQFFTMLGTRWGDKNPAPKSFVLSIIVHVVVMLAWSAVHAIRPLPAMMGMPENSRDSIPIRELVENPTEDNFDDGNTPVWQKLEQPTAAELARQERPLEDPEEMTEAPRTPVDSPRPDLDPTELADLPVQPPAEAPTQETSPLEKPLKPMPAAPATADSESTAESREDAGAGSPIRRQTRSQNRLVDSDDLPKTRGSSAANALNRNDDQALSIPLDPAGAGDVDPILSGQKSDTIRKGAAAATPSSAPDGDFAPDGRTDENGKPTFARSKGTDRDKTRRPSDGTEDDALPRRIPVATRTVPNPNPEQLPNPSMKTGDDPSEETPTPTLSRGGPNLPNRSPATYKLRQLEKRRGTALKNGGSLESEKAVENSLKWLAKVQEQDGSWDADKHGGGAHAKDPQGHVRQGGGTLADSGVTGLALLAFMGAGYTPHDGEYSDNVDRALKWLIQQQRDDGYLGGSATYYDQMYCHAIATFALGEACGMQDESERSPELRRAVRAAVEFIVERQCADGGWRYKKEDDGDMSMFGWQLMALKSADIAGVKVHPGVWTNMIGFLKRRSLNSDGNPSERGGLAGYNASNPKPTPAMTAEALFCKQMIGIDRKNPAAKEAVGYLLKNLPHLARYDEYYWYYGTMAMFQHGGDSWDQWNAVQRDLLIQQQETRGRNAGSWAPKGKWAGIGGRIYSTALSTLCLEVYYRYLPLYQTSKD